MIAPRPSGTVTFLFTDIEGSTRLWESAPEAMKAVLARHDAIVRSAIGTHDGYLFSTGGDGVAAAFGRAGDAAAAAIEIQGALRSEDWSEGIDISVRMGMHTGEADERNGDYFGPSVNRAARLMALGHGGQVLCSSVTAELLTAMQTVDLGVHRLKDLSVPQRVYQLGQTTFPTLRSLDAVPTNLPVVLTELVGRDDEVDEIVALTSSHRLVTITGVGGVGKTRLALAAAAMAGSAYSDGCWFVDLAAVSTGDGVPNAVAAAVGAPVAEPAALGRYLGDRRMLIVADNCEHLLDDVAALLEMALAAGRDPVVIATSREPLGVVGEQVYWVRPLALPSADADMAEAVDTTAVRLFVERAKGADSAFVLDHTNVHSVIEICRHLDGIPLALELAAARVTSMSPDEIAGRLDERFRLLGGGSRRSQERHRTLQAAVTWSHDLLSEDERAVFRRLSVFPASFDLDAAEAVAGDGLDRPVDAVVRLVERSLVVFESGHRYRMLETLRQFATDRLAEAGETDDTRARLTSHFCLLATDLQPALEGTGDVEARERLLTESDNLRVTRAWLAERSCWEALLGLCESLWFFWNWQSPKDWFDIHREAVERHPALADEKRIDALGRLAFTATFCGDYPTADSVYEECAAVAAQAATQPPFWAEQARFTLAAVRSSELDEIATTSGASVTAARAHGKDGEIAMALASMACALFAQQETARAREAVEEAIARATASRNAIYLQATVGIAASSFLWSRPPDFEGCASFLERFAGTAHADADYTGCWRYALWGFSLLATSRPDALRHLVHAANIADRMDVLPLLHLALRLIIVGASTQRPDAAGQLAGYLETRPCPSPLRGPYEAWVGFHADEALAAIPESDRVKNKQLGTQLTRRQMLSLIAELVEAEPTETLGKAPA